MNPSATSTRDATAIDAPVRAIAQLAHLLRERGIRTDQDRLTTAVAAMASVGAITPSTTYWALRIALCSSADDVPVFDAAYRQWLRRDKTSAPVIDAVDERTVSINAAGGDHVDGDADTAGTLASATERLRTAAFDTLDAAEREQVNRLIALIRPTVAHRRSRRTRPGRGSRIDASRTARAMLRSGESDRLRYRTPRTAARRVVLLLDVSGSMTPYAEPLLRFAHAAVQAGPLRTEVFTMGTRLTRVTRELRARDASAALRAAGSAIPDWSGGTRLGESLQAFLDRWGQRGAARGAVVVIASDGWERGDATLLGEQTARLSRLAATVIWAHPHQAKPGFAPATAGMQVVAPHVDHLVGTNSVQALEELAIVMSRA